MIPVGFSKRNKDYLISKIIVCRWLVDNKNKQINKHYKQSGTNLTLFKWLSDCLEDSYYDLDLDKEQIVIDLGFIKVKSKMSIQQIR